MLSAIEPLEPNKTVRTQEGGISVPPSTGFSEVLDAIAPPAGIVAGQTTDDGRWASMTHAALTGAAVASSPTGAYGSTYGTNMALTTPYEGGYAIPPNVGSSYAGGANYASGGLPTDPFLQQDYLINKMRETNMQLIQIQAAVQAENRQWTTSSNIMKAKFDTETAQIRNIRVG